MNISELGLFVTHLVMTNKNIHYFICVPCLGCFHPPENNYKNIELNGSPAPCEQKFQHIKECKKKPLVLSPLQCTKYSIFCVHISSHCSNTVEIGSGKCFVFDITTSCVLLLASHVRMNWVLWNLWDLWLLNIWKEVHYKAISEIENTIMSVINILCLYNSLESAIPSSQMWKFRRRSLSMELKPKENLIKTLIDTSCVHFRSISSWKLQNTSCRLLKLKLKMTAKNVSGSKEQRSLRCIIKFSKKRRLNSVCWNTAQASMTPDLDRGYNMSGKHNTEALERDDHGGSCFKDVTLVNIWYDYDSIKNEAFAVT